MTRDLVYSWVLRDGKPFLEHVPPEEQEERLKSGMAKPLAVWDMIFDVYGTYVEPTATVPEETICETRIRELLARWYEEFKFERVTLDDVLKNENVCKAVSFYGRNSKQKAARLRRLSYIVQNGMSLEFNGDGPDATWRLRKDVLVT